MTGTDMNKKIKLLKEYAKDQVNNVEDYFNKMIELEQILEDCRLNITTAKTQNGFALSSAGLIDHRDMEPTTLFRVNNEVSVNSNRFHLINLIKESEESSNNKSEKEQELKRRKKVKKDESADKKQENEDEKEPEKKKSVKPNFRPFGLLEPRAAKNARKISEESLERICELASIQSTIFDLEKKIRKLDDEIINELGDNYEEFLKISKDSVDSKIMEKEVKNNHWLKCEDEQSKKMVKTSS